LSRGRAALGEITNTVSFAEVDAAKAVKRESKSFFRRFAELGGNEHSIYEDSNNKLGGDDHHMSDAIAFIGDRKEWYHIADDDTILPESTLVSPSSDGSGFLRSRAEDGPAISVESLPSAGAALHAAGECRRCNFFAKGRCSNGKDCEFCHLPHEKRKLTRQEKRERRVAQFGEEDEFEEPAEYTSACQMQITQPLGGRCEQQQSMEMPQVPWSQQLREQLQLQLLQETFARMDQQPAGDATSEEPTPAPISQQFRNQVQQQMLGYVQEQVEQKTHVDRAHDSDMRTEEEEEEEDLQTMACSILPGLPPMRSMKLPAPLPLPGMAPPGLRPPSQWQPEHSAEAGPAAPLVMAGASLLSTVPQASSTAPTTTAAATLREPQRVSVGTQTEDEFECAGCDQRDGLCEKGGLTGSLTQCRRC
jgi:hypothetical protein